MSNILTEDEKNNFRTDKGPILIGIPKEPMLSLDDILKNEMKAQAKRIFNEIDSVANASIEDEDSKYDSLYLRFAGIDNIVVHISNIANHKNRTAFISYRFRNELRDINSKIYVGISEDLAEIYGGVDHTPFNMYTLEDYFRRIIALLPQLYFDKESTRTFENLTEEERVKCLTDKFNNLVLEAKNQNAEVVYVPSVEATIDWWSMFIDTNKSTPAQIEQFKKELRNSLIAELSKEGETQLNVDAEEHKNANIIEQAIINAGLDFYDFPQWRVRTTINCDYVVEEHTNSVIYDSAQMTIEGAKLKK